MSVSLSIVMPALLQRFERNEIIGQVHDQIKDLNGKVEFFCLMDNGPMSTGTKMSLMIRLCNGRYICGIGDDDKIEDDYVSTLLETIETHDVDVITFDHTYNVDDSMVALTKQIPGCREKEHGAGECGYETHDRLPGPLCPVKIEIARKFEHPDMSEKEDRAYKEFVKNNAKTYYNIDRVLYHHMWNSHNKRERSGLQWLWKRH